MAWLYIATAIIFLAIGHAWGYRQRDIHERYNTVKAKLAAMRQPDELAPNSKILRRPETRQERFEREHQEMLDKIGGKA